MTGADVIVIGGGIAGVSAAARLADHMSVLLLEAEPRTGYHATGRSAAIFIRNYGNAALRALNAASAPFMEAPDGVADSSLLSPRGELLLAQDDELDQLDAYVADATGMEMLSPAQAVELVPILRPDCIARAAIEWDAQDIDVDRMLAGFARLLTARGGRIVTGAMVTALRRGGDGWQVSAGGTEYTAPIVVNAAGAWAGAVADMAGALPIAVQPMRRSAAILPAPEGRDVRRWPLFGSISEQWYAKPEAGKLMVSPADEDPIEPQDAWADDMVLAEGLHRFEQAVTVPVTRVEHSWAGLRSFAPDRTPLVGFDPQVEGFFWLAGQGGYGVQTAPALSRLTAALIAGDHPDVAPEVIAALDPKRFLTA
ncbi:Hydrogen cyanide synthase subunit HcnC precursor [Thalassovita gelatinovora]|uniref:Hydrogen cyanide synthase subunit HcnC n=1 Tax=Thalassovita gelatinovora TaxID=53501 RepID=A0A0P1FCQ4_THAGE|nr:FAD-binding oxidoreductase [Thalassovita gelatinovora]QIZ80533.1 FAD-binding oxidoreductase [Thalassovita gelatinovora]CUH66004.1 Hydrogen cyanide synthase subunit HcnC precursor [Thalassovita gelatinovora]SEQ75338.1 Glycine/D-amino acid oxidase [Thalassovita gelatinovora]